MHSSWSYYLAPDSLILTDRSTPTSLILTARSPPDSLILTDRSTPGSLFLTDRSTPGSLILNDPSQVIDSLEPDNQTVELGYRSAPDSVYIDCQECSGQ